MKETKIRDLKKIVRMSYSNKVASEDFSEGITATSANLMVVEVASHLNFSYVGSQRV